MSTNKPLEKLEVAIERHYKPSESRICQILTKVGEFTVAHIVQFTVSSERGRKTKVLIDFDKQTVKAKNKLFKVVSACFSENKYRE